MCDLPLIRSLILAAQIAFLAAIALVIVAIATSSNMFTSGGSPVLLGAALALTVAAMTGIGVVTSAAGGCVGCSGAGTSLQNVAIALATALTAASVAIGICIIPSAVPFAGAVVAAALAISLAVVAGLFLGLMDPLIRLETCLIAARSVTTQVAVIVAVITMLAGLLVAGAAWNSTGGATCTGPNC